MATMTYREAVRDAMSEAMRRDDDVFIMGEDIAEMGGSMGVTQGMLDEFGPERVRNTPISEMAIVGAGIGAAIAGHAPDRRDHVPGLHDARDGAAREPGRQAPLHVGRPAQGSADAAHAGRRGLVAGRAARAAARGVVRPRPRAQGRLPLDAGGRARPALELDLRRQPGLFFEHRTLYTSRARCPTRSSRIELGKARVHREGEDVTVVATGRLVHEALTAAEEAEKEGISVEVVDPRTLLPLDEDAIVGSVQKTTRCVVAHEAVVRMGFGAEIAAVVQDRRFDYLDAPVERVGAKFAPLPFAPVMEQYVIPHADDVLAAVERTVGKE